MIEVEIEECYTSERSLTFLISCINLFSWNGQSELVGSVQFNQTAFFFCSEGAVLNIDIDRELDTVLVSFNQCSLYDCVMLPKSWIHTICAILILGVKLNIFWFLKTFSFLYFVMSSITAGPKQESHMFCLCGYKLLTKLQTQGVVWRKPICGILTYNC